MAQLSDDCFAFGGPMLSVEAAVELLAARDACEIHLVATRAAHGWQNGLSDRLTVQVMPPEQGDPRTGLDAETKAALSVLSATPGIAHASLLSDTEINGLVEPWIGKDGAVSGIPLPRLIDATISPGADVDISTDIVDVPHQEFHSLLQRRDR